VNGVYMAKLATDDATYKTILRALSKCEKSMPRDFVGGDLLHDSVTAMRGQPCAAQMLAVEYWIAHLQLICERRTHHLTFPALGLQIEK
jgi:hypothetical protein